jgi:hypothetical protein
MGSVLKCGYGCGAQATVDFLWPNDAEVWHVCDAHASALQAMLNAHRGAEWADGVVRWPTGSANGEARPRPNAFDDTIAAATDTTEPTGRLWPFVRKIRSWLSRGR